MWKENKREIHPFQHLKEKYEEQVKPQGELLSIMTSKTTNNFTNLLLAKTILTQKRII